MTLYLLHLHHQPLLLFYLHLLSTTSLLFPPLSLSSPFLFVHHLYFFFLLFFLMFLLHHRYFASPTCPPPQCNSLSCIKQSGRRRGCQWLHPNGNLLPGSGCVLDFEMLVDHTRFILFSTSLFEDAQLVEEADSAIRTGAKVQSSQLPPGPPHSTCPLSLAVQLSLGFPPLRPLQEGLITEGPAG